VLQTHMSISAVVTSGAGTAYPSGAPEFTPVVSGIHGPQYVNLQMANKFSQNVCAGTFDTILNAYNITLNHKLTSH
jgi:hypothetical protein